MSYDRLAARFQHLNAAMENDNPTDKLVAGLLVQVQEFIRSSGLNEDFMAMGNDELIRLAKGMGINGDCS